MKLDCGPTPDERLKQAEALLEEARDWVMGQIGSSYCETDKEDEEFVDRIDSFLGNPLTNWRTIHL